VTSIPAMSVLFTMCRKRVVTTFLGICFAGTLILAAAFQLVATRYPEISAMFDYVK
jgi:hypothetical protein